MASDKILMERIAVDPGVIEVNEIDKLESVGFCVDIIPAYYKCRIRITPYAVQSLLVWLLQNELIKLTGTLTVPIRGKVKKYVK